MCFFLGDKFNGSICSDIRGQHDVLKVNFEVIRVSNSAIGASPAVYSSRIPRANQDELNPPPRQSTQKPQQKQACGQHQVGHSLTRATIHDKYVDSTMDDIHLLGQQYMATHDKHVDSTMEDIHLLGQLYMTTHVREGNSDRLFEVENADCPQSLSKHGVRRSCQKPDLLSCLEVDCPSDFDEAGGKLIYGARTVHVLRPVASIE